MLQPRLAVSAVGIHLFCLSEYYRKSNLSHINSFLTILTNLVYSIVELCPHNDLSDLSIDIMLDTFESGYNNSASDQCSILADGDQCVTSFTLDTVASTWYNPGQLPSGFPGTAPLSDTTAGGSLTNAPAPYTYSIFPSYISVITPAPYNAKNAAGTGTVVETSSAAGTSTTGTPATGTSTTGTSATGTSSTTGATSSPSKTGAADSLVSQISFGFGVWGLAIQMLACALLSGAVRVA